MALVRHPNIKQLTDAAGQPVKDGLVDDVYCIVDKASVQIVEIADAKAEGGVRKAVRLKAVGSAADRIYQSGRVIPQAVQELGIKKTVDSGRQLNAYIEHPYFDMPYGNVRETCAVVVSGPVMDADKLTNVEFEVACTRAGEDLIRLLDSGVKLGVSQRALGRSMWKEIPHTDRPGEYVEIQLVEEITGIYGYDFVALDSANAGNVTEVSRLNDSVLAAARPRQDIKERTVDQPAATAPPAGGAPILDKTADEAKAAQAKAEGQLIDNNSKLGHGLLRLVDKIVDRTKAPEFKDIADAAVALKDETFKLLADSAIQPMDKNVKLTELTGKAMEAFSRLTGVPKDPAAAAVVDKTLEVVGKGQALLDGIEKLSSAADQKAQRAANLQVLDRMLVDIGGPDFAEDDKSKLKAKLNDSVVSAKNEAAVKEIVDSALELINTGRSKERLVQMGFKPNGGNTTSTEPAKVVADKYTVVLSDKAIVDRTSIEPGKDYSHLGSVLWLNDQCRRAAPDHWKPVFNPQTYEVEDKSISRENRQLVKGVLDQFDKLHGHELASETRHLKDRGNGSLNDSILKADFTLPITLARMVLFEVYADPVLLLITSFGTMENDRDEVPITRWRRESNNEKTFTPSLQARTEIQVGEFGAIPRGRLTTEYYPISAISRKLGAAMSDEFITRAKRRPDITGLAMAADNLVADVKRSIQQDVFWIMISRGLSYGAVPFTAAITTNGTDSAFQVTSTKNQAATVIVVDPKDAITLVPGSITVKLNNLNVPILGGGAPGGGPGGTYFYQIDYVLGIVQFVDASGALQPPPAGAGYLTVLGREVGGFNTGRFDLTAPQDIEHPKHMDGLLFKTQDLAASVPQQVGYKPDTLLTSRTTGTKMQQAHSYTPVGERRAFGADGKVIDGDFGITADLRHIASSNWPSSIMAAFLKEATLYRVYESMHLEGPHPMYDGNGNLIGGKQWYTYQEDSVDVPIPEKLAFVSVYETPPTI